MKIQGIVEKVRLLDPELAEELEKEIQRENILSYLAPISETAYSALLLWTSKPRNENKPESAYYLVSELAEKFAQSLRETDRSRSHRRWQQFLNRRHP
jgi:hypothetical protein